MTRLQKLNCLQFCKFAEASLQNCKLNFKRSAMFKSATRTDAILEHYQYTVMYTWYVFVYGTRDRDNEQNAA